MAAIRGWRLSVLAIGFMILSAPGVRADADKLFPDDTEFVLTLNFKQMLESPLLKKDLGKLEELIKKDGTAQKTLEALGFDPLKDLDSVTISGAGAGDPENVLLVIHGKFDPEKFQAVAEKEAKNNGNSVKTHKEDNHVIYEVTIPQQDRAMFVALVDGTTIVGAPSKKQVATAFDVQSGKKKTSLKKDLVALLEKVAPKQSISFTALGSSLKNVPQAEKIKHVVGGITFDEEIDADFSILTQDEDSAKELTKTIKEGLEQGKSLLALLASDRKELSSVVELIDKIKIAEDGKSVSIKGHVSKETINKINNKKD